MKQPCVYILASRRNGTLYLGVTSNFIKRIWQHKNDLADGFTKRYQVHLLVWYELHPTMQSAIAREKTIKEWKRAWKIELIEKTNPQWQDLYEGLVERLPVDCSRLYDLKGVSRNGFHLVQIVVIPTGVGGSGDEPV
jgi:putative endonuclease